jgi:hypothetical protein
MTRVSSFLVTLAANVAALAVIVAFASGVAYASKIIGNG